MRRVSFFLSDTGMTPTEPQCAGVQGEHNATTVVFTLPSSWIAADYAVRAEFVDGTGTFDTTAFLERTDSTVNVPLPLSWTVAGGLAEIRLAAAILNADGLPEETVAYSPVGYLYFESRAGEPAAWRSFENRGLSALIADSRAAAVAADAAAARVLAQMESGAFDGKDGEKGERGESGADGYGLLPVVQTIVSATGNGHHVYEVYVSTAYTKLPPVWMLAVYLTYGMTAADTLRIYGNGMLFETTAANYPEKTAAVGNNLFTFDGTTLRRVSGAKGENGADGVGIAAVEQTVISAEDGGENVFTVTLTDGQAATFTVRNGFTGAAGADGIGATVTVSDTFDPDSADAMSGKAVAQAVEQNKVTVVNQVTEGSTDAVSGGAVYNMLNLLSESVIVQDEKRVAIAQGTENAGKVLMVGADGNVTPQEMAAGSNVTVSDTFDPDSSDAMSGKAVYEAMGVAGDALAPQLLPTVTADDNGKLLQVVDGAWAAVTIPNGNEVAY